MNRIVREYKSEIYFGLILAAVVTVSIYFSRFIPDRMFDMQITPALNVTTSTVALFGAWLMNENPEMKLIDIAIRSGFSSREAFARAFVGETGTTPVEWKKSSNS